MLCVLPSYYMVKTSVTTTIDSNGSVDNAMIRPLLVSDAQDNEQQEQRWLKSNETATIFIRRKINHPFTKDVAASGDTFAPGSLNMTLWETFHRCSVDPVSRRYKKHESVCSHMAYSSKYGVVYHLLAKSASSTLRGIMKDDFEGKEGRVCSAKHSYFPKNLAKNRYENSLHFTFFRDPLPRFISGYTEFMARYLRGRSGKIPKRYSRFLNTLNHLLKNASFFNHTEGGQQKRQHDIYEKLYETEGGMEIVAQIFEKFVKGYDAYHPFDKHLMLQVPRKMFSIGNSTGLYLPLDLVFYVEGGVQKQMQETLLPRLLQLSKNGTLEMPNITQDLRGNSRKEKTNSMLDFVSHDTKQKICQLTALDYCCLNYPLPEVCRDVVSCRWTDRVMPGSLPAREGLLAIEALSPFPPVS
jgi:Sulfotransferase family